MNVFTFSGNLGRDAEQRYTQSQKAVVSFAVPVKSGFGDNQKTTWVDCALWGKRAEGKLHEHLKKGTFVVVSGEAKLETYPKNDGTEGAKLSVNVREISLGGAKRQVGEQSESYEAQGGHSSDLDDSIPFGPEWR